jgi:hypothetical protein
MALMTLLLWQQFKHLQYEMAKRERILNNKLIDGNQFEKKRGLKHCNKAS